MDEATVSEVTAQVDAAAAQLRTRQLDGPYGVRYTHEGTGMAWGNPVIGVRNPIAPPLDLQFDDPGKVWADFHLGAAYEGPPGHVHGGVCALVLDHVLGEVASGGLTRPAFTGTISCRYLRATRLGDLHTEATIERIDGVKTFAIGHLADEEGVTVEAEGVFIIPKWAR
jgi:acyl-coenzyme A thioesterase PaaI-like protein